MMEFKGLFVWLSILVLVGAVNGASVFDGGYAPSFTGDIRTFGSSVNPQFSQPSFNSGGWFNPKEYWADFGEQDCRERHDFLLMIPPGGCTPTVIRSDLLEEQNVPVFCKVSSIQVNPLIDVSKIKSVRFKGNLPEGISGVSYYPARAWTRSGRSLEGAPIIDNIGYLVVTVKGQIPEAEMPDLISGTLTAVIDYDTENSLGVGVQNFFSTEMSDSDWNRNYKEYAFWKGKGFLKVDSILEDSARVSIYQDADRRVASVDLKEGETSRDIHLSGYYCAAGMQIKLEDIGYPTEQALIRVDDEEFWVSKGSKFLNGKCSVNSVEPSEVGGGRVSVSCSGAGRFDLMLNSASAVLEVDGEEPKEYNVGEEVRNFVTEIRGDLKEGVDCSESLAMGGVGGAGSISKRQCVEEDYKKIKINREVKLAYVGKYPGAKNNYIVLISQNIGESGLDNVGGFIHKRQQDWVSYGKQISDIAEIPKIVWNVGQWVVADSEMKGLSSKERRFFEKMIEELVEKYGVGEKDIRILVAPGHDWVEPKIILKEDISGRTFLEKHEELKQNYDDAIVNYNDVLEFYPNEKELNVKEDYGDVLGAKALKNSADLSGGLGLKIEQKEFLEKLIENYPDSGLVVGAENQLRIIEENLFSKDAQAIVNINNEQHLISLFDLKKPSYEDFGVKLTFINRKNSEEEEVKLEKDEEYLVSSEVAFSMDVEISDIREDEITLKYEGGTLAENAAAIAKGLVSDKTYKSQSMVLKLRELTSLNGELSVRVDEINFKKQATVRIIPKVYGTRSEANLSFGVGIEKRAIKLSPKKTHEMIDNLEEQLEKWGEINDKLGKVVKGLKGACFATSAMLTVKNFFAGTGGEAMARNEVMTSGGGWNEKCRKAFADGAGIGGHNAYASVQDCLIQNNDRVEADVQKYADALKETNKEMEKLQTGDVCEEGFLGENCNIDEITKNYRENVFRDFYESSGDRKFNLGDGKKVAVGDIPIEQYGLDEMKKLVSMNNALEGAGENSVLNSLSDKTFKDILYDESLRAKFNVNNDKLNEATKGAYGESLAVLYAVPKGTKEVTTTMTDVNKGDDDLKKAVGEGVSKVVSYSVPNYFSGEYPCIGGKEIILGLEQKGESYHFKKGDVIGGSNCVGVNEQIEKYLAEELNINSFKEAVAGLYKNEIKDSEARVKYYESPPNKGLPALVPFNHKDGWYAATDYIVSGFGQPFEDSGKAVNFWICNVGENGLIEYKQGDECRYYNKNSPAELDFPGLSKGVSAKLVRDADTALRTASRHYSKSGGKGDVRIGDRTYETGIAENGETGRCSDFMSPSDCNLMFNVCDPVICPASRCDYGGKYRVANVVQSGIIGSLLLCLPNADEGIIVPICLTGVNAGLDAYMSILNSTHACLKDSLETGRNIGICDEVKSVYMCEFFWRQAVPLMDIAIPSLFEMAVGQGARGGGEYLTVKSAWDNMKQSADYFKNEYAVNAFKAFNMRSTAEAGTDVCKMFVSASYPGSADFFDELTEPESPAQYYAHFSENSMTTATIPAMSHYKVYYHIYSGKDIGANYVVYLSEPTGSGLISIAPTYVVDRGYIGTGSQVDEARDFTAVSGYQKLCVNINGQDECGFGQVTTSFALDYLSQSYVAEQSTQKIESAEECIAGTSSLLSFAQPNLQAGAEDYLNPEVYKKGVIRVCATSNPGAQTEAEMEAGKTSNDRWKDVGYCDDKSIRCWIDTDSVKDVLSQNKELLEQSLEDIDTKHLSDIIGGVDVVNVEEGKKIIEDALKGEEDVETTLEKLKGLSNFGQTNWHKAKALFLIGDIYKDKAVELYRGIRGIQEVDGEVDLTVEKEGEDENVDEVEETASETEETVFETETAETETAETETAETETEVTEEKTYSIGDVQFLVNDEKPEYFTIQDDIILRVYFDGCDKIKVDDYSDIGDCPLLSEASTYKNFLIGKKLEAGDYRVNISCFDEGVHKESKMVQVMVQGLEGYEVDEISAEPYAFICNKGSWPFNSRLFICYNDGFGGEFETKFYVHKNPDDIKFDLEGLGNNFNVGEYGLDMKLVFKDNFETEIGVAENKEQKDEFMEYEKLDGMDLIDLELRAIE